MDRGERRRRTEVDAKRSQYWHTFWFHPDGKLDCECEKSIWFFAKKGIRFCRCSKKKKGRPKIGVGTCKMYLPRAGHLARRQWRKTYKKLRDSGWDD